jgi:8-oxo-dGTP pyrophosphatase MutT (NUDIX family)
MTLANVLPSFDPRRVPVVGVDGHLPKVPPPALQPLALEQRFRAPPTWVPELHGEPLFSDRAPVHASVLIPLVMRDSGLTVLLTERTTHLSNHSGQIAFPGGKDDPEDNSPVDTALREAEEEIGLNRRFVEVLGSLPIYTTGSAYVVTPVVALVRADYGMTINPHEVADVFEVPLDFLMNPANHRRHSVEWAGSHREWFSMPYHDAKAERFIWGATAGMLRNLYRFLLG